MLIAVIGDLGSGKTLFLVMVAVSSEKDVISNFKLNIDNYSQLDVTDLINLGNNKTVLLDEAYTWLESRVSSSFLNRYISYILFQSRHRDLDIYTTEQLFNTIDVRFRELVHKVVKCERIPNHLPDKDKWDFRFDIYDTYSEKINSFILKYEKAKQYFSLYDTLEIVEPFNIDRLEVNLLKDKPEKLHDKIEDIAIKIFEDLNRITHASVKMAMLKAGYSLDYEPLVYSYLKDLEEKV